jgi:hypothetical protein
MASTVVVAVNVKVPVYFVEPVVGAVPVVPGLMV